MSSPKPKVELLTAWIWDCPTCGEEQIAYGEKCHDCPFEPGSPEAAIDAEHEGEWVIQPTGGTCVHCGLEVDFNSGDEDPRP